MKKNYYVFYNSGNTYYEIPDDKIKELEKIINKSDIIQEYQEENECYIQLDDNEKIMNFIKRC